MPLHTEGRDRDLIWQPNNDVKNTYLFIIIFSFILYTQGLHWERSQCCKACWWLQIGTCVIFSNDDTDVLLYILYDLYLLNIFGHQQRLSTPNSSIVGVCYTERDLVPEVPIAHVKVTNWDVFLLSGDIFETYIPILSPSCHLNWTLICLVDFCNIMNY